MVKKKQTTHSRWATGCAGPVSNPDYYATESEKQITVYAMDLFPEEKDGPDGPLILTTKDSRIGNALGAWFVTAIWNAISWTIAYFATRDGAWLGLIFIGIFLLIGVGLFLMSIYVTLQIFNPKCTLVCSQSRLYPGSEIEISWTHRGNAGRIEELTIALDGFEEVTYKQGTTTRTESSVFFQELIVQTTDRSEINEGFRVFTLPKATMHCFKSNRNAIVWQIQAHGRIAFWPDVHDTFPVTIYPPNLNSES